ncbi:hypothetical protein MBLNU457_4047t1 [Dothideomycetes sp. NU457]
MAPQTVSQSSQSSLVASSQPDVPTTPTLENATLPAKAVAEGSRANSASLTPPPSSQVSQIHRNKTTVSTPAVSQLSSPPATLNEVHDGGISDDRIHTASSEELRNMLTEALAAVQEAQTTAAHYRLQHQMAQMESGEAVERMAVEMDMAKRELEVVQRTEAQRQHAQNKTSTAIQPESDPNFRLVHVDVYQAMTQEIRNIKLHNAYLERENAHQKRVVLQQENEIATLNDRVLLMRERIRENRDHLTRYRRTGSVLDNSPRTDRSTPYHTPASRRAVTHGSHGQPGFAALLQATDIVSQGQRTPTKSSTAAFYTPQQPRRVPMQAPYTAPMPRKRVFDATQPVRARDADSDGTVSADDDSEAETEVPGREDNVDGRRRASPASEMLKSPSAGRGKTSGQRGMVQSKLFGQIRKPGVFREEQTHKRSKITESDETHDQAPNTRLQSFRAY